MKFINKYNLPAIVEKFIVNASSQYSGPTTENINTISVTTLLDSPYIRQLTREFWDDIEIDVRSRHHMVLGSMAHYAMELVSDEPDIHGGLEVIQEKRIEIDFFKGTQDHMILSGQFDKLLIGKDAHLVDVKTSGVFSMNNKEKREKYEQQVNIYRYMIWKKLGIDTKSASLFQIAKDWRQTEWEAAKETGRHYPQPFDEYEVRIVSYDVIEKFIERLIKIHAEANRTGIETPHCTEKERWSEPFKWAVEYIECPKCNGHGNTWNNGKSTSCISCKGTGKPARSLRNFEDQGDAKKYIEPLLENGEDVQISPRPPKRINMRCKSYCDLRDVCPYYQNFLKEGGDK